jgi:hypothetical protein
MKESDIKLLSDNGWQIACESPLEIEMLEDPESTATGWGAEYILAMLKYKLLQTKL